MVFVFYRLHEGGVAIGVFQIQIYPFGARQHISTLGGFRVLGRAHKGGFAIVIHGVYISFFFTLQNAYKHRFVLFYCRR